MSGSLIGPRAADYLAKQIAQAGNTQRRTIGPRPVYPLKGFAVEGTPALYKVIALREYDENGDLVDIGDESNPLAEGHELLPTYDWLRAH